MASSLVSNTNQVHFASVLAMDNSEMVSMFEALVASGLNGFLGCMSEISETALIEFYENASLPVEGLIDISEVPKDLIFDARTEFSLTVEQLTTSCKKRELKIEYRLLSDIVAKSITVKAGSFDAVTHERFLLMTAIFGDIVPVGPVLGVFSIPRRVVDNVSYRIHIVDSGPTDFVPSSPHQSSTSTSSMHFTDEILSGTTTVVGSTPTAAQFSLPPAVSDSFNDLRTSMSRIISIQSKESRRLDDSHSEVLDKIKQLETTILDTFYQKNQTFHRLITGIRQEAHNDTNALSLGLKFVHTQTTILSTEQADARKEDKEQKAIIEDMDERLATLRSEHLDFRAQAQENYNNLSSQLGELVAYINRGNDKKGEDSSSRRPQPPPDDLNRPSGGNASRGGGGGGSGGSGRRDDRKGSSTKKGSGSSGAGGPYKKNAEWWLYGKNQF
ncbi:U-box domain-containing protein 43 [Dorcoceras hygrometricum]|uniref:U-box domain-containing protein 43 n=1 Tax=Dorcoceras hygrometricum TaxID=472368 RepID=A0A2Z7AGQ3_9LAMI|nr:U-box domain-containing protein 43 [Dorcoceras hygrometricum]